MVGTDDSATPCATIVQGRRDTEIGLWRTLGARAVVRLWSDGVRWEPDG